MTCCGTPGRAERGGLGIRHLLSETQRHFALVSPCFSQKSCFRKRHSSLTPIFYTTSLNPFSFTGKSAASLGPLALAFLQHLGGLTQNHDSFYSVYPPPKSFWSGSGYHP